MLGPNQMGRPETSGSMAVTGPKEVRTCRIGVGEVVQRRLEISIHVGALCRDSRTNYKLERRFITNAKH